MSREKREEKKTVKIIFVVAAVIVAALGFWLGAQENNSANYAPTRYVIVQGVTAVANVLNQGGFNLNNQQCVFKLDTRTGDAWILQLAVNGSGDPSVRSAVWAKVQNSGIYYPLGPPMPQQNN